MTTQGFRYWLGLGAMIIAMSAGAPVQADEPCPTCGLPHAEFATTPYHWPQPGGKGSPLELTFSFGNLLDGGLNLDADTTRAAIYEALELWASVTPITFREIDDVGPTPKSGSSYWVTGQANLRFNTEFIDGQNGANTLAFAYYPFSTSNGLAGDLFFDNGNTWRVQPGQSGTDLLEVAVHEIGHTLGLGHEPMPYEGGNQAIMNPYYGRRYSGLGTAFLYEDDIEGIQSIYGVGAGALLAAVPEPASISLLVVLAGGLLFRRTRD